MWIFVAILVIIILYLIVLASGRADELQREIDETDDEIEKLSKNYEERLEREIHNNIVIVEKNRKLQEKIYQIEDLILGQRTDSEVREKIKELLFSYENNNQKN